MHGVTWSQARWHGRATARPAVGVRRDVRASPLRGFAGAAAPLDGSSSDESVPPDTVPPPPPPSGFSLPGWASPARNWPLFLRTFAVSAVHVAARALSQPLAPALDRLQARAETSPAVTAACAALRVDDLAALRDVCNAVVLSECVYKAVGRPEAAAVGAMSALRAAFPPALVSVNAVQFARPHVRHRFAVAESEDAVYVALMGTKLARDFLANAAVWQEEVALDATMLSTDDAEGVGGGPGEGAAAPAAHRGFLTRARGIPIDALFHEAQRRGKRLVFTGHSLGGAVAALCAVRLLQRLPPELHGEVAAVGFAAPPLGNEALAALVEERGWGKRIRNYTCPEDPIPGLLSAPAQQQQREAATAAAMPLASASAPMLALVSSSEDVNGSGSGDGDGDGRGFGPVALGRSLGRGTLRAMGAVSAVAGPPARAAGNILLAPLAAPLRAARPKYLPLGQQLYLCEDAVRSDKPPADAPPPARRRLSAAGTAPAPPPDSNQGWWAGLTRSLSASSLAALFPSSSSSAAAAAAEGDDDNIDVAAAAAAAGALVPDRLPARTLFPMHRMLTYRSRVLGLCREALEGHAWPAAGLRGSGPAGLPLHPALPVLPSFPSPDGISHSELLAPAMFPVRAVAAVAPAPTAAPAAPGAPHPAAPKPFEVPDMAPTASSAVRRRVAWPLRRLLRRPRAADDATPLEVTIRVEGKGMANVTDCWVSGGAVDAATGKAAPVQVAILSQPRPPAPAAAGSRLRPSLLAPLAALASWVAMAVGWVALVARLQPAGSGDFLLARAQLPAGVVRRAARAARDPLAAAVGDGPRLMLHLRSDFEEVAVPLGLTGELTPAGPPAPAAEGPQRWGGAEREGKPRAVGRGGGRHKAVR